MGITSRAWLLVVVGELYMNIIVVYVGVCISWQLCIGARGIRGGTKWYIRIGDVHVYNVI